MEITIINIITILIAVAGLFVAFLKAGASARSAHNAEIALQRNERLTSVTLVADALKSFAIARGCTGRYAGGVLRRELSIG